MLEYEDIGSRERRVGISLLVPWTKNVAEHLMVRVSADAVRCACVQADAAGAGKVH